MQIHEITKLQRTDEGILDSVKKAVNATKTGYANAKDKFIAAGDRAQEKQWDKKQDKRNAEAAKAAQALQRKGFNVDTTTQAAKASTPTRIKQQQQQKITQLQKAFDQEFDIKAGGAGPAADEGGITVQIQQPGTTLPTSYTKDNNGVWTDETGQKITDPKSVAMLNAKADNPKGVQLNPSAVPPVSPVKSNAVAPQVTKEARVNPNRLATMKTRARAPGVTQPNNGPQKKDIAKDFNAWISQHIPGLQSVPAEVKQKLTAIFDTMKVAKTPQAIDMAFQQYVDLALSSVGRTSQGQQAQGQSGLSASAQYAQQGIAHQLGISPAAIATLQQKIQQNGETISNPNTGSQTLDTLIQAVKKR